QLPRLPRLTEAITMAKKKSRTCGTCRRDLSTAGPLPGQVRGTCNECGYPWRHCAMCGEAQKWDESDHPSVERVVRAHENYGGVLAGGRVRVELNQIDLPHVQRATMSLEEAKALDQHRREAPLRQQEPPRLVAGLSRVMAAEQERLAQQVSAG